MSADLVAGFQGLGDCHRERLGLREARRGWVGKDVDDPRMRVRNGVWCWGRACAAGGGDTQPEKSAPSATGSPQTASATARAARWAFNFGNEKLKP